MAGNNPVEATLTAGVKFQINSAKLYVPVVTLPINNNIKFLESSKQGFRRLFLGIGYVIDPTFMNINVFCSFIQHC